MFLAVLDVNSVLRNAVELSALEVEDAVVGFVGEDGADACGFF